MTYPRLQDFFLTTPLIPPFSLACIFAITHGVVPPTINCENLDPEIDPNLNLTLNKAQKREVRCALSNTFGFGGHNSTVIFRKI